MRKKNIFGNINENDDESVRYEHMAEFQTMVEDMVKRDEITYLEAIAEIVEAHDVESETINALISGPLRHTLTEEAESLNLIHGGKKNGKRRRRRDRKTRSEIFE